MAQEQKLRKAVLQEIEWVPNNPKPKDLPKQVTVQFNPDSLKVAYSNQLQGDDKKGAVQFVSKSTTKLAMDLWFDVTVEAADRGEGAPDDVRKLTREVSYFMEPQKKQGKPNPVPPGVRFLWGSFLFEGIMESMNESLELFSEQGKPLRSKVSIGLVAQNIERRVHEDSGGQPSAGGGGTGGAKPGTVPQETVRQGETVQDVAGRQGQPENWRPLAEANNVDNPRRPPGQLSTGGGRR